MTKDFKVGDLVSARLPGLTHEEVGSIVEVGCVYEHAVLDDGNHNDSDSSSSDFDTSGNKVLETALVRRDGIKVFFPVNNHRAVVPPENVLPMKDGTASSSSLGTASSPTTSTSTTTTVRRGTRARRSAVTPSPQPAATFKATSKRTTVLPKVKGKSDNTKPSAKRKRKEEDSEEEKHHKEEVEEPFDNVDDDDAMEVSSDSNKNMDKKTSSRKRSPVKRKARAASARKAAPACKADPATKSRHFTPETKEKDDDDGKEESTKEASHAKGSSQPTILFQSKNVSQQKEQAKTKRGSRKSAPTEGKDQDSDADESSNKMICLPVATNEPAAANAKKKKSATKPSNIIRLESDSEAEPEAEGRINEGDNDNSNNVANDNNASGGESSDDDRPFTVEYSPSSRSTCRRCDSIIQKGDVRISHVPLFRGKPGYRVYRHLPCAVFSEEVTKPSDVSGWRRLQKTDLKRLEDRIEESAIEVQQENEELQPDELVQAAFSGEIRPPPPGLAANLLPFQTEGFSWMRHQEKGGSQFRGGILADEMGMGKTLQTIATILDNRPILQHSRPGMKHPPSSPDLDVRVAEEALWSEAKESWQHEMGMLDIVSRLLPRKDRAGARAGTLVICPVIALYQWKTEIEKFTENSETLTIGTYHGPNRAKEMPAEMMSKYDIVLTTYQCLEQDFRKMMSPNKVACPNCGGKFKLDKLKVHLKYFCGESAQRTEAQARQRRTADRQHRNESVRPSGGKGKNSKKPPKTMTKKSPMKKVTAKAPAKKRVRVSGNDEYDSDSDLSVPEEPLSSTRGRPTRSGAAQSRKNITKSVKAAGRGNSDDDESSYGTEDDDGGSDEESSDDGSPSESSGSEDVKLSQLKKASAKKPVKKKAKAANNAAERARQKQRQALEALKSSRGKKAESGKKTNKKNKSTKMNKKKFEDDSSDDDSVNPVGNGDPMEDVDMEELSKSAMSGARFSILHSFCWWRVVLDEAHYIKSRSSQTAAAAFSLTSVHRWCLSGTPLQNRVGELYSLIRFLRIDPMAYYFCRQKGCNCKSIHYRFKDGRCKDCGHRPFTHFAHFNRHVLNAIQRDGYTGDGRRAMFKLKNEVLDKCLLRRTKETRAEDMNLPPRIVSIRTIRLHPKEEDFYEALYKQNRASFDDYVAEGTLLSNYAHIFDLLTKMRQAVDHPYLIVYSKTNGKKLGLPQGLAAPVANGSVECDICHEPFQNRVVSSCCGAGFCRSCVIEYLEGAGGERTPCPSCESPFSVDLNQASSDSIDDGTLNIAPATAAGASAPSLKELPHVPSGSILRRINLAEFTTSTKIETLIQELIDMRKQRPGSKALVFSQFVNMLDLIRWRIHSDPCLADLGLGVRILHGGMDVKSRDEALKDFRENSDVRILLMSLKSGGVALNLTVASEVYLVDNWWNPAVENQAIDRTHRLGQYRPIRAVRLIAEGTVEERVLQLQEKKRLVFDGTVGRDAGSLKMLTVDDMKSLFT